MEEQERSGDWPSCTGGVRTGPAPLLCTCSPASMVLAGDRSEEPSQPPV
jgi:hypothetical protein